MSSISLNGETRELKASNIQAMLNELGLGEKKVAVELNKSIVSRDTYSQTPISDGDQVEIVHFIGGG